MLLQRFRPQSFRVQSLRHPLRCPQLKSLPLSRQSILQCRPKTTSAPAPKPGVRKTRYPERLLIYHAGTGRTVFLGCLKVTTVFICVFFCAVMAPTHFFAPDSNWVAAAVFLSGVIPVTVVAYISSPFVTYIHLRLPHYAQNSREILLRYSKSLPATAELDITTMNFIGKPRVARMKIGDLKAKKARFGFAGFERDTRELEGKMKWWMGKPVKLFGVTNEGSGVLEGEVWRNVERGIRRAGEGKGK